MFVFEEALTCEKEDIAKPERIATILKVSQSEVKSAIVLYHLILFVKIFQKEIITNTNVMKLMIVIIHKST